MSSTKWKNHLLSTGVPLEHSVRKVLRSVGFAETPHYEYDQADENGVKIMRSVDVHATQTWNKQAGNIEVEYLIECKYVSPHRNLVFFPAEDTQDALSDILNIFDDFSGDYWLGPLKVKASEAVPPSENGVLVSDKEGTVAEIRTGLYQLKYATMHRAVDIIESQLDFMEWMVNPATIVLPVLVTSANLWRVTDSVEVDDILKAESLADIASPQSAVVVRTPAGVRESTYVRGRLRGRLSDAQMVVIDDTVRRRGERALRPWLERAVAGSVVVVTLERFRTMVERQVAYFSTLEFQRH